MKPIDPCLIDSSVWVEGQRNPEWLSRLLVDMPDVATCYAAACEYAVGMYAAEQKPTRDKARLFFENAVSAVACHPHLPDDFLDASRLIGEAIYAKKAKPTFADGLIAACARRLGRTVWTKDKHFEAMGCKTYNPLEHPPVQPATT